MVAYEKYITIDESQEVVLSNLPMRAGQRVRVVLFIDDADRRSLSDEFRNLLATTQALPQAQQLTEEEIAAEVDAYRSGRS